MSDKTYAEGLREDTNDVIDHLAEMNDDDIVEATLHRNSVVALQTAIESFARQDSDFETGKMADHRADVATHTLSLIDAQMMLNSYEVGNLSADIAEDLDDIEEEFLDTDIRLPRTLALTAFVSAVNAFFNTPDDSGLELTFAQLVGELEDDWPDIADQIHTIFSDKLGGSSLSDFKPDEDDDFTTIDINDIGDDDDE